MPLVRVVTEGDRALVLARRAGRWRALARYRGPDAEARATALAAVVNRGLARPASELGAA